jgi:hypothetical protein
MATTSKSAAILVGIDDQVIELTGEEKEAFLAQRAKDDAEIQAKETELIAKAEAKAELLARLGITAEEAQLLLS